MKKEIEDPKYKEIKLVKVASGDDLAIKAYQDKMENPNFPQRGFWVFSNIKSH